MLALLPLASESSTWTAVLAGLIPILGIAAVGLLVWWVVRKDETD